MKSFLLAAIAVMGLSIGVANVAMAQPSQTQQTQTQTHRPNYYNWLEGGGG